MATWQDKLAQQTADAERKGELRPGIPDLKSQPSDAIPVDDSDNEVLMRELEAAKAEGFVGELAEAEISDEDRKIVSQAAPPAQPKRAKGEQMKSAKDKPKPAPAAPPTPESQEGVPQVDTEIDMEPAATPLDYLRTIPGAPNEQQINAWKKQYGDIYMMPMEGTGVFIFRYLNYQEWKYQLQPQEKLMQDQEALKEAVLVRCSLFPKYTPENINAGQAGIPDLMFEIIMKASYFVDANEAMMSVMRL